MSTTPNALRHDPAMRWIVGGKATLGCAASSSQMGRFETKWLAVKKNLSALPGLSGQWIDRVQARRLPRSIVLDSSVSPTHGEQEMSVWNGHFTAHAPYSSSPPHFSIGKAVNMRELKCGKRR